MRILLTNDDGIDAAGLHVLAGALSEVSADLVVAAPSEDMSGSGAAIGPLHLRSGVELEATELPDFPHIPAYRVDGPPGLAVLLARLGAIGPPPDLVVSGINPGNNCGRSVLHSGTVGAALTSFNFGASGIALSLGSPLDGSDRFEWGTAKWVGRTVVEALLPRTPRKFLLNVNIPGFPMSEIKGWRRTRLAAFGTVRAAVDVDQAHDSPRRRVEVTYQRTEEPMEPDTDTGALHKGLISLTWLHGIGAIDGAAPGEESVEHALGLRFPKAQ
jgi:5'/3'-nucleotidase